MTTRNLTVCDKIKPGMTLAEVERLLILITLAANGGNRTKAAAAIGLSLKALSYKIKRFEREALEPLEEVKQTPGEALALLPEGSGY